MSSLRPFQYRYSGAVNLSIYCYNNCGLTEGRGATQYAKLARHVRNRNGETTKIDNMINLAYSLDDFSTY